MSALRQSYYRLSFDLDKALGRHRVLLITPRIMPPAATRVHAQRPDRRPAAKPLATPDPRLLHRLDPQLQEFAAENQAIEEIFTREIVRDVDSKVLDLRRLFEKGSLEVSFEVGDHGNLNHKQIDTSSGVPSIDHLALEIVGLVEKYHLAWVFQGFSRVALLIRTGDDVEIRLSCTPRNRESQENLAKRIQGTLTLVRMAAAESDAAFLLQDVSVAPGEDKITLSRTLPKYPLARFLMRYWQSESPE